MQKNSNQRRARDKRLEARVVLSHRPDGMVEVFAFDPQTNREIHTRLVRTPAQARMEAKTLARQFERAGNSVCVVERKG